MYIRFYRVDPEMLPCGVHGFSFDLHRKCSYSPESRIDSSIRRFGDYRQFRKYFACIYFREFFHSQKIIFFVGITEHKKFNGIFQHKIYQLDVDRYAGFHIDGSSSIQFISFDFGDELFLGKFWYGIDVSCEDDIRLFSIFYDQIISVIISNSLVYADDLVTVFLLYVLFDKLHRCVFMLSSVEANQLHNKVNHGVEVRHVKVHYNR